MDGRRGSSGDGGEGMGEIGGASQRLDAGVWMAKKSDKTKSDMMSSSFCYRGDLSTLTVRV